MREEHDFQDWTAEQDERLRASLGALRHDVDAAGLPDVRFVMRRAGRQRQRAVAGVAAGAAAVLGLSWFGYQAMDSTPSTAPAGDGTGVTTQDRTTDVKDRNATDGAETDDPRTAEAEATDGTTGAEPVNRVDLVTSASSVPDVSLFVPPASWASDAFTDGRASESVLGAFESTGVFGCDPDDVGWGTPEEGTFGMMWLTEGDGNIFATQRVRVLESPTAADEYAGTLHGALADCRATAEAGNVVFDVEPLQLSGAYRFTTEFGDGNDPIVEFVYVVQHQGTPEAVSTIQVTDWSGEVTDAGAASELQRLADLVVDQ